jgi:hypothetical protein
VSSAANESSAEMAEKIKSKSSMGVICRHESLNEAADLAKLKRRMAKPFNEAILSKMVPQASSQ